MDNHPRRQARASRATGRGFSLLEVMVAVFVLAVGLVSVGGLQFTSKRSNFEAVQRATAAMLAQDMMERMRANPSQLHIYNDGGQRVLTGAFADPAFDAGTVTCEAAACTPGVLAQYDFFLFDRAVAGVSERNGAINTGGLVSPTACITGPPPDVTTGAAAPGVYTVAVAWRGSTRLSDPTIHTCGQGTAAYAAADGTANLHRRVLVLRSFIDVTPPGGVVFAPGT
jgi:type IV pilus assembly protein PilV